MDRITKEHRSWNMSQIKSRDTQPEVRVRKALHNMGYRFRLHRKDLPGRPDIVLPKYGTVIFVNGCYWHHHPGCKYAYTPKSRIEFWTDKFAENIERDHRNQVDLQELGWRVGIIWECETEDLSQLCARIRAIMSSEQRPGINDNGRESVG